MNKTERQIIINKRIKELSKEHQQLLKKLSPFYHIDLQKYISKKLYELEWEINVLRKELEKENE